MWMLPLATAVQHGASKINTCLLCVRVLSKTRTSFIRSFSRLSKDASYLRTGVKGWSKIRRVLAKPRLVLDEICRLYGTFACCLRRVLCKTRLIFPRINGPLSEHFCCLRKTEKGIYCRFDKVQCKKLFDLPLRNALFFFFPPCMRPSAFAESRFP